MVAAILHPFRWQWLPVLSDIDLELRCGEILGVVGPNGAGKSTLLRILCGLLLPDSGSVRVCGVDLAHEGHEIKRKVGYVPADERGLLGRISGFENLEFFARLNDLSGKELQSRVMRSLERVGLAEQADKQFMNYSSGMKQRLLIARGLLIAPEVLLLDEPTRSLDPFSASTVRALVNEIRSSQKCSVIIASHNLVEIEAICDRVVVLSGGRILVSGTIDEVVNVCPESDQDSYQIAFRGCPKRLLELADALGLSGLQMSVVAGNQICLRVRADSGRLVGQLIADLLKAGFEVDSLAKSFSTLEDTFLRITRELSDSQ